MHNHIEKVEQAIRELKAGKMIIVTDDPDRENEGDLIALADTITEEQMNFMIRNGTGIVCLALTPQHLKQFQLPLMVAQEENSSMRGTPFTVSIDAAEGITTGVSAADRIKTVQAMMNDDAVPADIVKPGHIFPLQARSGGVLQRRGHTEGAVDFARLAGFKPAAVLCEIMNMDGSMASGKSLEDFAEKHNLFTVSIEDLVAYRLRHENILEAESSAILPLENYGTFKITVFKDKYSQHEHVVLYKESKNTAKPPLVRIHSSCMTGDLFFSQRCDCNKQLHYSLQKISHEGGVLIYLSQEGRGIGLFNKIKAYSLQESGHDTVQANIELGLPVDSRRYFVAANILREYNMHNIRLLTANPNKIRDLKLFGIDHIAVEPMPLFQHEHNKNYLKTKIEKLNHTFDKACAGE